METEIRQRYQAIRQILQEGVSVTVLHIGEKMSAVATGSGAEPEKIMLLAIGSHKTAADFFLHTPPTPGEIENAIMQVEDEIARTREMIAGYSTLVTSDVSILKIAHIVGAKAGSALQLPVDDVERVFSMLARLSQGAPAASAGIPPSPTFAATLLILREFMHHLGFALVSVMV